MRSKVAVFMIKGFGCDSDLDGVTLKQSYTNADADIEVMCPTNVASLAQIIRVCVLEKVPHTCRPFFKKLVTKSKAALATYDAVLIVGHSHGGLLATLAAKQLASEMRETAKNRLHIMTLGSIFTEQLPQVASFRNYMYPEDIALLCKSHVPDVQNKWKLPSKKSDAVMYNFNHAHVPFIIQQNPSFTYILPKDKRRHPVGHSDYPNLIASYVSFIF